MQLADKIIELRKTNGMSQEDLAEKLNVSRQAISRWELKTAMPDANNILQISKLFGVTTDYLLYDDYESADYKTVHNINISSTDEKESDESAAKVPTESPTDFILLRKIFRRTRSIVGCSICGAGLLGFFIVWIVSKYHPATYVIHYMDGSSRFYDGFAGYIMTYQLGWLLVLLGIVFVAGLIVLDLPKIAKDVNDYKAGIY